MVVTQKIEVGISSNLLHSISTSMCIRKCNKNWGSFQSHFPLYSAAGSDVDLFERAAADLIIKTEIENIRRVSGIEDFNYEPINIDHCDITGGN